MNKSEQGKLDQDEAWKVLKQISEDRGVGAVTDALVEAGLLTVAYRMGQQGFEGAAGKFLSKGWLGMAIETKLGR